MNKKAVIFGILVISLIVVIVTSMSSSTDETFDVDMTRTHGSISTALGSPILGDPDAPVTIVNLVIINAINVIIGLLILNL